jgi:hypothetical protein
LTEAFSGDALAIMGEKAAIVTAAKAILRMFMVVFLEVKNTNAPPSIYPGPIASTNEKKNQLVQISSSVG